MLNPIFSKKVQGQKHPGRWSIVEHQIPSIKMLFKTNTKSHKHPSIRFLSKSNQAPIVEIYWCLVFKCTIPYCARYRADSTFTPSQWEVTLQSNASLIGWVQTWNQPCRYIAILLEIEWKGKHQFSACLSLTNSLAPERFEWLSVIITGLQWWLVNISLGNRLMPSGNKPLPEPMLTKICVTIWHQ